MSLETGSYINDLNILNPTTTDPKSQGDDHFRLLKSVLKECLNGFTGGILLTATDTGSATAHVLTPTTALVAYELGLDCIGCDRSEQYVSLARGRVLHADLMQPMALDLDAAA